MAGLAAGFTTLTSMALPAHASATPATAAPGLEISVSDGRAAVRPGDRVTYLVRVQDTGSRPVHRLEVTQALPAGVQFVSASDGGTAAAGRVTWHASLAAGGTDEVRATVLVTRIPAKTVRLAAVACAALPADSRPVICAAHLDPLPAGGGAAVAPDRVAAAGQPPARGFPHWYLAAGAGLAALVLALIGGRVRRRG